MQGISCSFGGSLSELQNRCCVLWQIACKFYKLPTRGRLSFKFFGGKKSAKQGDSCSGGVYRLDNRRNWHAVCKSNEQSRCWLKDQRNAPRGNESGQVTRSHP